MSTELIINASLPETRIALLENGEIQELLIERASGKGIVGNIYKGRVTRVLPGMQAAFVDIGLEKAAFLYVDDVFVHSEVWEAEEGGPSSENEVRSSTVEASGGSVAVAEEGERDESDQSPGATEEATGAGHLDLDDEADLDVEEAVSDQDGDQDDEPVDSGPEEMSEDPEDQAPAGTVAPTQPTSDAEKEGQDAGTEEGEASSSEAAGAESESEGDADARRKRRRGRRGGRNRRRGGREGEGATASASASSDPAETPEVVSEHLSDEGFVDSDRSELSAEESGSTAEESSRPRAPSSGPVPVARPAAAAQVGAGSRPEFRENRDKNRRIKPKPAAPKSTSRAQVNIQDLLKEGQEVLVQVAKDPIATKGARLTCHISLPGRHLVCMPTIDHVGVSRRIERDDERRRLREFVERNRPKALGFIVRTASGKQSEKRVKQDIDYLTRLWGEIQEKAKTVSAPALVYEDLNAVLRSIRDWVNEEIDKIVVDSRYHYNEIQRFVGHFMPSLRQKAELYQGDVPIFDAFNISSELSRALERKVWLKSGGYIVIDQAEALVAIDVNTGRFVGKKNLEDTILKTNLEAVQEIAYQLRLRNCGGIIVLDLIDMEKEENKHRVYRALEEALRKDRARPTIQKISELGLIEMTRKRTRDTMVRALCESCPQCEGKGFVKSRETVAYEVLRDVERDGIDRDVRKILVQAHTDVIDLLAIDERETLDQLERRFRKPIYLQAMGDYHLEQFEVVADRAPGSSARDRVGRERDRERERRAERQRERDRLEKEREKEREAVRARLEAQRQSRAIQAADISSESVEPTGAASVASEGLGNSREGRHQHDRHGDRHRDRREHRHARQEPRAESGAAPAAVVPVDPDSIGNRADVPTHLMSATSGFQSNTTQGGRPQVWDADEMDEEDRLAYQRAQAAQDAAIANLNRADGGAGKRHGGMRSSSGMSHGNGNGGGGGGAGRDRGRDRDRRGRRGGRDRDRGRDRHRGHRDRQAQPSAGPRPQPSSDGGDGQPPVE